MTSFFLILPSPKASSSYLLLQIETGGLNQLSPSLSLAVMLSSTQKVGMAIHSKIFSHFILPANHLKYV